LFQFLGFASQLVQEDLKVIELVFSAFEESFQKGTNYFCPDKYQKVGRHLPDEAVNEYCKPEIFSRTRVHNWQHNDVSVSQHIQNNNFDVPGLVSKNTYGN
jgi:hypothetical protein